MSGTAWPYWHCMVYKMIKGHTFTKSYIDKVDKEQLAKKLADFMNELYEVPVVFDKKIYVEQELNNAKINLELLREYLDDEKYSLLLNWYNEYIEYLSEFADCRAKRTSVPYSADSLRHN